jgi:hypothetical protein
MGTDTDVELAKREGFHAVEHLKRYTTLGMATEVHRVTYNFLDALTSHPGGNVGVALPPA